MSLLVISGLSILVASAISFISFGFTINNLNLVDLKQVNVNASNFSNSSFIQCQHELEAYIVPVNIVALVLPFVVGFLIIATTFGVIYSRKHSFNIDSNADVGISSTFIGLMSNAFAFQIGWPFVTPVLTILYSYGYAILEKCAHDVQQDAEWYSLFDGLRQRYVACIIVCTLGDSILFIWLFIFIFLNSFAGNSFAPLENII